MPKLDYVILLPETILGKTGTLLIMLCITNGFDKRLLASYRKGFCLLNYIIESKTLPCIQNSCQD
jgi:hypothetical protein